MDVKSQLVDAQIEQTTQAGLAGLTPKKSRFAYTTDTDAFYIGDGTNWRQVSGARIGDVKQSMLPEADFITEHGADWILCDGRDITGSDYANLTGITAAPDLRGRFARGKDHGTGRNPDGDTALGAYQADAFQAHDHNLNIFGYQALGGNDVVGENSAASRGTASTDGVNSGNSSSETRPKNVTVNFFIKINR